MKKRLLLVSLTMSAFTVSCASTLKAGAEKVKISESLPPMSCTKIEPPYTHDLFSIGSTEDQKTSIREIYFKNAALDKGGNYVKLEKVSEHKVVGTIFHCPQ